MKKLPNLPRQVKWAVPAGIIAAVGGVLAASTISVAATTPQLPPRTSAQLLAAVDTQTSAPLTGTVVETASLGLPTLPSVTGTISLPSLLAGSQTIDVWYSDPAHYRLAVPQPMSESDLIRNGSNIWLWGSSSDQVTHMTLPPEAMASPEPSVPLTPQQAADQALTKVGATTTVKTDKNVTVAGQAAYQLVLVPKSSGSLIGEVRIAVDSEHNVPLRVQVFAKGTASPVLQVGFTSVSFGKPSAANFAFRPPSGAMVVQENTGSGAKGGGKSGGTAGGTALGNDMASGASVIGKGWLAVADLPESSLSGSTQAGNPVGSAFGSLGGASSSGVPAGRTSGQSGLASLPIGTGVIFSALLQAAKPVSGSWGSGRLIQTSLVSMLVTSKGRVLIGAVTPEVLYQAAVQGGRAPATGWHQTASQAKQR